LRACLEKKFSISLLSFSPFYAKMLMFPGSGSGSQSFPGSGEKKKQQNGLDEADAICDVCKDGAWWGDNQILICEGTCLRAVHQTCVGAVSVPDGKWLCDGCKHKEMFPQAPPLVCFLCKKDSIGIMKPLRPHWSSCFTE
jgi:hypothetical protein